MFKTLKQRCLMEMKKKKKKVIKDKRKLKINF